MPEYLRIVGLFEAAGWSRRAFWPHGEHLFALHLAAGLALGGAESNPLAFAPFGGFADGVLPEAGVVRVPEAPGVGFETQAAAWALFRGLLEV